MAQNIQKAQNFCAFWTFCKLSNRHKTFWPFGCFENVQKAQNKNVQKARNKNVQKAHNFYAFFKFCVFSSNKRVWKILIKELNKYEGISASMREKELYYLNEYSRLPNRRKGTLIKFSEIF